MGDVIQFPGAKERIGTASLGRGDRADAWPRQSDIAAMHRWDAKARKKGLFLYSGEGGFIRRTLSGRVYIAVREVEPVGGGDHGPFAWIEPAPGVGFDVDDDTGLPWGHFPTLDAALEAICPTRE